MRDTLARLRRCGRALISALLLALIMCQSARAARPDATHLFPKNTYIFARVSSVPDLKEHFQQSSLGRMLQDPQLAPLFSQVYSAATEAMSQIEDRMGMTVSEVLAIPQGEIAFAVVGGDESGRVYPMLLVDIGDKATAADKLINGLMSAANGVPAEEFDYEGLKINSFIVNGQPLFYCVKDQAIVLSASSAALKTLLSSWSTRQGDTLSDNDHYAAAMRSCMPATGQEPQLSVFADPVALIHDSNQGGPFIASMLTTMGLDGVFGVGGTMSWADGEFDGIMHVHLLLDNPRTGVVGLVSITSGDSTPEAWAPAEAASYMTIHWDVMQFFKRLTTLVDSFSGEGFLSNTLRDKSAQFDVDLEKEVLPALEGRFTHLTYFEKPVTVTSQATILGAKLKDPAALEKILDKFAAKIPAPTEKKSYGTNSYYEVSVPMRRVPEEQPWRHTCLGVVGNYLLLTDRPSAMEKAILCSGGDASLSLASALEYKLIASKISRQPGGKKPGMVAFNRPEESFRWMYDLAASDASREWLKKQGEKNKFFQNLGGALDSNPLPPFSVIAKYLAPGGSLVTDEETGIHYMSFSLKRD